MITMRNSALDVVRRSMPKSQAALAAGRAAAARPRLRMVRQLRDGSLQLREPRNARESMQLQREVELLQGKLNRFNARLDGFEADLSYYTEPQGPGVLGYSQEQGIGYDVTGHEDLTRGGATVGTPITFLDNAAAGTVLGEVGYVNIVGANVDLTRLARIQGTMMCYCLPVIAGPGNAINETNLINVTLHINGTPVSDLFEVPVDLVTPTVVGEQRAAELNRYVRPMDVVSFVFTVGPVALGGQGANNTANVTVVSGSTCAPRLRG